MTKNNKSNDNYLDYIPVKNPQIKWEGEKEIILLVENKGWANRLAQKIFKKPKFSKIHLEEMGSFIWPLIDGQRSVYDISVLVKEEFGDKAEPLYNRLVQYMKTLQSYEFINMRN